MAMWDDTQEQLINPVRTRTPSALRIEADARRGQDLLTELHTHGLLIAEALRVAADLDETNAAEMLRLSGLIGEYGRSTPAKPIR